VVMRKCIEVLRFSLHNLHSITVSTILTSTVGDDNARRQCAYATWRPNLGRVYHDTLWCAVQSETKRNSPLRGISPRRGGLLILAATHFPRGLPQVPSAQTTFTSVFGMGDG